MNPKRVAETDQALREAGVPQEVVNYVIKSGVHSWVQSASALLSLPIMVAGFAVIFALWPRLESATAENAKLHAESIGGLLYHHNFGLSLVLAGLPCILISGLIGALVTSLSRRLLTNAFIATIVNRKRSAIGERIVRKTMEQSHGEVDPARYVRRVTLGWVPAATIAAAALSALSAIAVSRDIQTHSIFTSNAYVRSPFFPWGSTQPREWASAASVEVGCNHVEDDDGTSDHIIYSVRFHDGASVDIGYGIPLEGSWLSAAETIDRKLRAAGAAFTRWEWLGRDPMHPRCIAAQRQRFSEKDYARVQRLLRVTE